KKAIGYDQSRDSSQYEVYSYSETWSSKTRDLATRSVTPNLSRRSPSLSSDINP
ncbi:hypothetical protein LTR66_017587, partial [Elasticomyces elasticus]